MGAKLILKCLIAVTLSLLAFNMTTSYDRFDDTEVSQTAKQSRGKGTAVPMIGKRPFYRNIPALELPANWKHDGCGTGPPPEITGIPKSLEAACGEHIRKMEMLCGKDELNFPGAVDEKEGDFGNGILEPYDGRFFMVCHTSPKPGHVVHILTIAGTETFNTCGEVVGKQSVLDIRVEGPRSIEYAFQTEIYRWMKVISFRPMEVGSYKVRTRPHLMRQNYTEGGGFKFQRTHGRDRFMSTSVCDVRSCRKRKKPFHCKVWQDLKIEVPEDKEKCLVPYNELPFCHQSYPTYEDHWFGRWVDECSKSNGTCTHPITTRPLDNERSSIDNHLLLQSVGACGPTIPHETHKYSKFVFNKKSRWGYRPHLCRPRYFSVDDAWDCLSRYSLLNVGDSIAMTNGHQLFVWMGAKIPKDTHLSQRGNRTDERLGQLSRKKSETEKIEFHSIGRSLFDHLSNLKRNVEELYSPAQKVVVVNMGLHNSVHQSSHINQQLMRENIKKGFDISYPFIYHPIPGTSVDVACGKKNSDRAWRVNSAVVNELYNLSSSGEISPGAILPSFFMGKSLHWEVSVWDSGGTHPFCSFLGLTIWQQTLDLVCPV